MSSFRIVESTKHDMDFIEKGICDYNESHVPFEPPIPVEAINRHIKDEYGDIVAGINCIHYAWKCIAIDALWVREDYRKKGLGSRLLREIENAVKAYGCHLIHVDTFDFQAKDFYVKHGYEIFGVLEDCPLGHQRYYLKKSIS
ncbi:GNAT family N-acetyltransferase [Paenibacillus guangzhouensis]|uniref:GNAT family N-acetyltransferase n=1 Tax=Paenibacillus guangzhouensis TaxID=1473112 RepID=UPI001266BEC4|nr:GNAT family N-acetyltransferase [Paenibacillus guangzhouensis]